MIENVFSMKLLKGCHHNIFDIGYNDPVYLVVCSIHLQIVCLYNTNSYIYVAFTKDVRRRHTVFLQ